MQLVSNEDRPELTPKEDRNAIFIDLCKEIFWQKRLGVFIGCNSRHSLVITPGHFTSSLYHWDVIIQPRAVLLFGDGLGKVNIVAIPSVRKPNCFLINLLIRCLKVAHLFLLFSSKNLGKECPPMFLIWLLTRISLCLSLLIKRLLLRVWSSLAGVTWWTTTWVARAPSSRVLWLPSWYYDNLLRVTYIWRILLKELVPVPIIEYFISLYMPSELLFF